MNIGNDYPAGIPEEVKKGQQGNLPPKSTYYKIVITGCGNTLQEILQTGDSPQSPSLQGHTNQMDLTPMAKSLIDSNILKHNFDIYECPTSNCKECTGSYSGLGMKCRCLCSCHKPSN